MKKERRPLNQKERLAALILGVVVHYLIRLLDDLKNTSIYRQELKASANHFQKLLERHAAQTVWDEKVEGADTSKAADQMEQLAGILDEKLKQILKIQ